MTLVFLHGFMGSAKDWDEITTSIKYEIQCLAIDLPGHGQHLRAPIGRYTLQGAAIWLLDLLSQQGIKDFIPVGYSMGGRLAFHLLLNFQHRLPGAIVISASPGLETPKALEERIKWDNKVAHKLMNQSFETFLSEWYAQSVFGDFKSHAPRSFWEKRRQNDPQELAKVMRGMGTGQQSSFWEALGQIGKPILYLAGENDTKYCTIARRLYEYTSFSVKIIPDCGHSVHLQKPQQVIKSIKSFLPTIGGQD
jgi:2-succinyl-6-hydroxy-2,4-cyclohexadiene-1-carboxylate synthase